MERLRKKMLQLRANGAPQNQINAVQNEIKAFQKKSNEMKDLKSAQVKSNNSIAAAATQTVNAVKAVAVNLHKANQNRVTPSTANTTAIAAINNAKNAVNQSKELLKLAKNLKKTANKLELLTTSGGKRRTRRIHRK